MRWKGTVKWFNDAKGYGFIGPDAGGEDIFVHYSEIEGKGHRKLDDGDIVEFEVGQSEAGRTQAQKVRRIAGGVPANVS